MDHVVDHLTLFEGEGRLRDYPGNYSQYLAYRTQQQRNEKDERQKAKGYKPHVDSNRTSESKRPRATYKQQQAYKTLTEEIDALTRERQQLEQLLGDATHADLEQLTTASHRIGEVIALLDEKELAWLELDETINS